MLIDIIEFTGGLANKLHPSFIKRDQGTTVHNTYLRSGMLVPRRATEYKDVAEDTLVQIGSKRLSLADSDMAISMYSDVVKSSDGVLTVNGIPIPLAKPKNTQYDINIEYTDEIESLALDVVNDSLSIAITNYSKSTGIESKPVIKKGSSSGNNYNSVTGITNEPPLEHYQAGSNYPNGYAYAPKAGVRVTYQAFTDYLNTGRYRRQSINKTYRFSTDFVYDDVSKNFVKSFDPAWSAANPAYTSEATYGQLLTEIGTNDLTNIETTILGVTNYVINESYSGQSQTFKDDLAGRVYEFMLKKGVGLTNWRLANFEYATGIKDFLLYLDEAPEAGYEYRVYMLGQFNNLVATEYTLISKVNSDAIRLNSDTSLIGGILTTLDNIDSLDSGYITATSSNLFVTKRNSSELLFTTPGTNYNIKYSNSLKLSDNITGLIAIQNAVLVTCADATVHIITGSDASNLQVRKLASDIDCVDNRTMVYIDGYVMWLSTRGLVQSSVHHAKVLLRDRIKASTFSYSGSVISAATANGEYYILLGNSIFLYDLLHSTLTTFDAEGARRLWLYKGYVHASKPKKSGKLGSSITSLPITYTTGKLTSKPYNYHKEFARLLLYTDGPVMVEVFVDDTPIMTTNLDGHLKSNILLLPATAIGRDLVVQFRGLGTVLSARLEFNSKDD